MQRFWSTAPSDALVLVNRKIHRRDGPAPVLYAEALVETVKVGLKHFRKDVLGRETIGNVDVVVDANNHNDHPGFRAAIEKAREVGGAFRAVNRVSPVDSAASRLLQLADVVAHSRKWIARGGMNGAGLRDRFGIRTEG